ncbi:unnamed protein product, partial [Protopolystoma xenopodis]
MGSNIESSEPFTLTDTALLQAIPASFSPVPCLHSTTSLNGFSLFTATTASSSSTVSSAPSHAPSHTNTSCPGFLPASSICSSTISSASTMTPISGSTVVTNSAAATPLFASFLPLSQCETQLAQTGLLMVTLDHSQPIQSSPSPDVSTSPRALTTSDRGLPEEQAERFAVRAGSSSLDRNSITTSNIASSHFVTPFSLPTSSSDNSRDPVSNCSPFEERSLLIDVVSLDDDENELTGGLQPSWRASVSGAYSTSGQYSNSISTDLISSVSQVADTRSESQEELGTCQLDTVSSNTDLITNLQADPCPRSTTSSYSSSSFSSSESISSSTSSPISRHLTSPSGSLALRTESLNQAADQACQRPTIQAKAAISDPAIALADTVDVTFRGNPCTRRSSAIKPQLLAERRSPREARRRGYFAANMPSSCSLNQVDAGI